MKNGDTMKNLLIIRHAKSSWDDPELDDHERPLNKRGLNDAPLMGNILTEYNLKLDKVYSSTAKRARMTIEIIANIIGITDTTIEFSSELYNASRREILNFLRRIPDELKTVAIVGHNPGLTDIVRFLLYDFDYELPTCAIVCMELEITSWSELKSGVGTLKFFEFPKKYK